MKILLLIITCFMLCSCSYVEVNNLDIVNSIAIDYLDSNYYLKLEVITNDDVTILDGTGKSISEAFESITLKTNNNIYLAHLDTVFFTESVDLDKLINYFLREEKVNTTFYLLLTDSIDIYSKEVLGSKINQILNNHNVYNFFHIAKRMNTKSDFIIPFYKNNNIESGYLFKDNKALLEVSYDYVEIYKILDNIDGANLNINNIDITLYNINSKFSYNKDINIYIYYDIKVNENNSKYKLDNKELIDVENIINKEIKERINNFIKLIKYYDCDLFGFNNLIKSKEHSNYKDWINTDINVDIVGHISKKGLIK